MLQRKKIQKGTAGPTPTAPLLLCCYYIACAAECQLEIEFLQDATIFHAKKPSICLIL
jgi:hypothetical protein